MAYPLGGSGSTVDILKFDPLDITDIDADPIDHNQADFLFETHSPTGDVELVDVFDILEGTDRVWFYTLIVGNPTFPQLDQNNTTWPHAT